MRNLPLMDGGHMSRRNVQARWTQKGDPKGLLQRLAEAAIFEYAFKLGMQIAIETLTE